jgi:hypothetical protein
VNRKEAAQVLELRQHLWPHTPKAEDPAGEVSTWATLLSHRTVEQVVQAMRALKAREFAPTLGQIDEMLDPQPTPATIYAEFALMYRSGYSPLYTPPADVPFTHPAIRAAADAGLWEQYGWSPDPTYDEYAGANLANWRKAFDRDADAALQKYRAQRLRELTGSGQPELES